MAKNKPPLPNPSEKQTIEDLQKRYGDLYKKKIEAETELKTARTRLYDLKTEAREKFGTDDLGELERKLEQMRTENEEKRAQYQADLDRIERDLEAVEQKFAAAEDSVNGAEEESR
jgi:hypothetical protein